MFWGSDPAIVALKKAININCERMNLRISFISSKSIQLPEFTKEIG